MRRLAVTTLVTFAVAAAALFVIGVAQGCGPTPLSKSYAAYDGKAEVILDREAAVWRKLLTLLNEQAASETPDPERFRAVVVGESVPFYESMKADVAAAAPAQPELAAAHEKLVKYADRRAAFARLIADSLDVLRRGDPWHELDAKDGALQSAMADYAQRVQGRTVPPDQRFNIIQNAEKDFQRLCVEPLGNGRLTAAQMGEIVKTQIQPKIREARATQFEDDEEGRSIRAALAAADEFFDAVQKSAELMETSAKLKRDTEALAREGDELVGKFRDEMKAVRGRM